MRGLPLVSIFLLCSACPGKPTEPAATATPATPTDAPAPKAASFPVDVFNFAGVPCETIVGPSGQPPEGTPVTLEPQRHQIEMHPGESLFIREVGGEFGLSASVEGQGGAIVILEACHAVEASDEGFEDAALAMMRPHELEACCTSCEGGCSDCTIPEGDVVCTKTQVVQAKCTQWNDILHCEPAGE